MKRTLKNILYAILILSLLQSCISFPSNNVKLERFPKYKSVEGLNIRFLPISKDSNWVFDFEDNGSLGIRREDKRPDLFQPHKDGCSIEISRYYKTPYSEKFDIFYTYVASFTLFVLPYYRPRTVGIKAKLIDAKTGKVLKDYFYKEKASKIISSLMLIPVLLTPVGYDGKYSASGAIIHVKEKVREALVRQVTNDAYNFEECLKKVSSSVTSTLN